MSQQSPTQGAVNAAKKIAKALIPSDQPERLAFYESAIAATIDAETNLPALIEAAQDFVDKVDQGRAKSTDSYAKFKAVLKRP